MASLTGALKNYNKKHVTVDGAAGVYIGKELDDVSSSIGSINDLLKTYGGYAALSGVATGTFLGNISGGTAVPIALTATQVTASLNVFTTTLKGLVPAPGTATGTHILYDTGWAAYTAPDLTPYMQKANNLSDVANVATAVANLGLTIGTNVQAYDAQLTSNIRQNKQNADYTLVLADGEKQIYCDTTGGYTWTIPANASVPFPIGSAVTFVNTSAGVITLAITTDTLYWSPSLATGSRTLASGGMATALKIDTTKWIVSGTGLS